MPKSSKPSRITCLTSFKFFRPVICRVPVTTAVPSGLTIRRYPHQLDARPAPHLRIAMSWVRLLRSQVLKAHGTNNSSAALLIEGSAKIAPASLHPAHPDHSTKLAKIGLPVRRATSSAFSNSPWRPSGVRFT